MPVDGGDGDVDLDMDVDVDMVYMDVNVDMGCSILRIIEEMVSLFPVC